MALFASSRFNRLGTFEVMARLARGEHFFRTLVRFIARAPQLVHLNRVLAIAVDQREARRVLLDLHRFG